MKKILSIISVFLLALSTLTASYVSADYDNEISFDEVVKEILTVPVYIDGIQLTADVPPQVIDGAKMVPLRAISEAFGAEIEWDNTTKTATATKGETVLKVVIGENKLLKNDVEIPFDVPAKIVDSRTFVPFDAIAESFDCFVEWSDDLQCIRILSEVLNEAVTTDADKEILCYFNESPVSASRYNLYSALLKESLMSEPSNEQVTDLLKEIYAAKTFVETERGKITILEKDYINGMILKLKNTGFYELYLQNYNTTDSAFRAFFEDSFYLTAFETFSYPFTYEELIEIARKDFVNVKHILVKTKEEADLILLKLDEGAVFEDLAKEFSLDGMDIEKGYIFTKGEMVESFEKASFELEDGEISSPVESVYGFHIIKKYPMSELSDEYLLSNYSGAIFNYANSQKINLMLAKILSEIVITYA
ncbi:MAG: hypothetical protein E7621_06025 [Ruminococcaceae bacterium]|nr:hypothetical protein [Oscillospiraceae bacterium]